MKTSRIRALCALFACAWLLVIGQALISCTSAGGDARQIQWDLPDSLKNYSKVIILVIDGKDSARVDTAFQGKLSDPKSLPAFSVPDSIGSDFHVRVQAFDDAGQLAFQSTVDIQGGAAGGKTVLAVKDLPGVVGTLPGARLASLDVSAGALVPAFKPDVFAYTLDVPFTADSLAVNPVAADTDAALALNGQSVKSGVTSALLSLKVGDNPVVVGVTPKGGSAQARYVVTVRRGAGDEAGLDSIAISAGSLTPAFNPDTLDYLDTVAADQDIVSLLPVAKDSGAMVVVTSDTLLPGQPKLVSLTAGSAFKSIITVTSVDRSARKTYSVTFFRKFSPDAALSALSLSDGVVVPAFDPAQLSYTAVVAQPQVSVLPVSRQVGATITIEGKQVFSGGSSDPISVNVGQREVIIAVTAPDGKSRRSYSVMLIRSSPNALLSSLIVNGATLDSAFQNNRLEYHATVARTVQTLVVDYQTADVDAKVSVTANGIAGTVIPLPPIGGINRGSTSVTLKVGANAINVVVTAPDTTSKTTYTVHVLRQPATLSELTFLTLSAGGGIKPAFDPAIFSYADTAANFIDALTATTAAKDSNATVILRLKRPTLIILKKTAATDSISPVKLPAPILHPYTLILTDTLAPGKPSQNLNLQVGVNLIEVQVIAEDGTTNKTYSVFVQRLPSPNSTLSALTVGPAGGTPLVLNPTFVPGTKSYIASTFSAFVVVTPTAAEPSASILVNGVAVANGNASGSIGLVNGLNNITVHVTAPDRVGQSDYFLQVTKRTLVIKPPVTPLPQ